MKKIYLPFLIIFLIVPVVFADIAVQTDQPVYNLGNMIKASASVLRDKNFDGLFKLSISCGGYKLSYFLTPISLEGNARTAVNVPDLQATSQMLGNCSIIGDLTTNENLLIEEKESNWFRITNELKILPVNSRITSSPSDTIQIAAVVNEAFGNNVLKAPAKIELDNNTYSTEAVDGKFSYSIPLPRNIKSGKHLIKVTAADSRNNFGDAFFYLDITAIPSYIQTELSQNQIEPGTRAYITSSLYDQADDLINDSLGIELTSPKKNKVFTKIIQSNVKIDYEFSQFAEPGLYLLKSTYRNLVAESAINITTVRDVKIKYENESVVVENTGNIPFDDDLTFFLQNELKKYAITKKISIDPGKILSIDLSKEVPFGVYNVMLPIKEGIESLKDKANETVQNLEQANDNSQKLLADGVTIHDNRPIYKKVSANVASISSNLVGADGVLTKNPLIAPVILSGIILLIIFRYGRKPIMKLIKGKKHEEHKEN